MGWEKGGLLCRGLCCSGAVSVGGLSGAWAGARMRGRTRRAVKPSSSSWCMAWRSSRATGDGFKGI